MKIMKVKGAPDRSFKDKAFFLCVDGAIIINRLPAEKIAPFEILYWAYVGGRRKTGKNSPTLSQWQL